MSSGVAGRVSVRLFGVDEPRRGTLSHWSLSLRCLEPAERSKGGEGIKKGIMYKTIPKTVFPRHTPSSPRPRLAPFVIPAQAGIQRTPFP